MPSVADTILTYIGLALVFGAIAASIARGVVRRYLFITLYAAAILLCDALRYIAMQRYGFSSKEYFYTFYVTDAILVTLIFLLILSFFETIFGNTPLRSYVRWVLLFLVVIVGVISDLMISHSLPHFYSRLLVEFLQNMYFAAVVLTALLWLAVVHLRVEERRLVLLIAGLGVLLSSQAATYAIQNLLPQSMFVGLQEVLRRVPALATIAQFGLWFYALAAAAEYVPRTEREAAWVPSEAKGSA
jgi:hypothetical protein